MPERILRAMSRLRLEEPGAYYHLNANALHGMSLFRDEVDRLDYLDLLCREAQEKEWIILEYSLMTTHWHILLKLREPTLSRGFQRLQSLYARRYNSRHKRRGVVWQCRFHSEPVTSERHLFEVIRYIARNAPRAGICERPEDWEWCSYGAAIGIVGPDPLVDEEELLGLFSSNMSAARRRLQEYVEEPDPRRRWRQTRVRLASDAEE